MVDSAGVLSPTGKKDDGAGAVAGAVVSVPTNQRENIYHYP